MRTRTTFALVLLTFPLLAGECEPAPVDT